MQSPKITSSRWRAVLSLLPPVISFILVAIALFAGTGIQHEQLEEYHILSINISNFGVDLLRAENPSPATEARNIHVSLDDIGNAVDSIQSSGDNDSDKFDDLTNTVSNGVGSFPNQAADDLANTINNDIEQVADSLHLPQWYSLHITNYCQGVYTPNATASGALYNTTHCTAPKAPGGLNLSTILTRHVPFLEHIGLTNLPLAALQDAVGYINSLLLGTFVFYVLSFGVCGFLALLGVVAPFFSPKNEGRTYRRVILAQMSMAGLACLLLAVASITTTLVARRGAAGINDAGGRVGVSAHGGMRLIAISWAAFAVMFVDLLFWIFLYSQESRSHVYSPYGQLRDN